MLCICDIGVSDLLVDLVPLEPLHCPVCPLILRRPMRALILRSALFPDGCITSKVVFVLNTAPSQKRVVRLVFPHLGVISDSIRGYFGEKITLYFAVSRQ